MKLWRGPFGVSLRACLRGARAWLREQRPSFRIAYFTDECLHLLIAY